MTREANRAVDVEDLRRQVTGHVITPDDAGYEKARELFLARSTAIRAVIVQVADVADVATVLPTARQTGLDLAIRSGGHSAAGHGTTEGGIVLDVRGLKALEIDRVGMRPRGPTRVELLKRLSSCDRRSDSSTWRW